MRVFDIAATMRVATVDIGTNTVLLLVAEMVAEGGLVALEERATVTRLGQGVDETRVLNSDAIERTCACLKDYASRILSHRADRVAVVATSAMRDAVGGAAIADFVASNFGTALRIITGGEEARLMFAGSVSGLGQVDFPLIAFDVGGGSTEVVRGKRDAHGRTVLDYFESFDIGSVRLTERHRLSDPPSATELDATRAAAAAALAAIPIRAQGRRVIGTAGTVTTLAAISLGTPSYDASRVHGLAVSVAELERVVTLLAASRAAERNAIAGIHPGRADIIVAGGIIVLAVLRRLEATELTVSDRGLRWGLAAELASSGTSEPAS